MCHALNDLPAYSSPRSKGRPDFDNFTSSQWDAFFQEQRYQRGLDAYLTRAQAEGREAEAERTRHDGVSMRELWAATRDQEAPEERTGEESSDGGGSGGGASPLLESSQKQCDTTCGPVQSRDEVQTDYSYELRPCRCKSWYCPDCCWVNGMDLRRRLKAVLQTFEAVQMWTFTVDPLLFSSPRQAWDYLKEKRCISRLMRSLRNGGYLLSDRYFYVVEWQKETEMVHFHVLVEARHIPIERVRYEWSKFRPDWAGPQEPNRPAFGTVRFTKTKPFVSMEHAANYATKYLTKTPEHGFPSWVLDSQTYMRRYQTSRYFWPAKDEPNGTDADDVLQPGQRAGDTQSPEEEEAQQEAERTTIRQRLAECKQGATVILKVRTNYPDGRVFDGTRHVMNIGFSFARCLEILGFRDVDLRKLSLSPAQLRVLDREWLRFEKDGPDGSEN